MDFGAGGGAVGAMGNHGANVDMLSWYVAQYIEITPRPFVVDPYHSVCCHIYRYMEIPLISRLYLTGAFLTTAACAVDIISPFNLYFNWDLVFSEGQVWRLITSYLFFGVFSVDFLFHMYFLVSAEKPCMVTSVVLFSLGLIVILLNYQVRYSRLLEEGDFRGRTANYVLMLLFGIACISIVAVYTHVHFLGSALTFMMVYVWGRRNEDVKMSFLGFFQFNAPYLPWGKLLITATSA
jgi:Derlin-2/3